MKNLIQNLLLAAVFCTLLLISDHFLHVSKFPSLKIYDLYANLYEKLNKPAPEINDFVVVGIDHQTITNIAEKWPYSRATFATVIENLKKAEAKVIGLDFNFFGNSDLISEDETFKATILESGKVVFGAYLTDEGKIQFSTVSDFPIADVSGFVNKLQDSDGQIRSGLTYLVNGKTAADRFFSWELKILQNIEYIDLNSLKDEGNQIIFTRQKGQMIIPVDPVTKTFLIRFQAHTEDFSRLSFYEVFQNKFDPNLVKGKIVLIGFLSEMFQDVHKTPIGWLSGFILNANVLLTLYSHGFITPLPYLLEIALIAVILLGAVFLLTWLSFRYLRRFIFAQLVILFGIGYFLFSNGFVLNYALFTIVLLIVPILVGQIYRFVHRNDADLNPNI